MRLSLIALTLLTLAGALALAPSDAQALTLRGKVVSVADGDTITVRTGSRLRKVRLLGIDAPETRRPGGYIQCGGPAASARLARVLPRGRRVRLVTDPTQDRLDRYRRLLAYVYVGRNRGVRSVNRALVRSGHVKRYIYRRSRPFRYLRAFTRAQRAAKRARRGVWGPPCRGNTRRRDPRVGVAPSPGPCDPNYAGACIPPYPPDLDCSEITDRNYPVVGEDPHNFDVDNDRIACEN
jgi:micrococcal nuclease